MASILLFSPGGATPVPPDVRAGGRDRQDHDPIAPASADKSGVGSRIWLLDRHSSCCSGSAGVPGHCAPPSVFFKETSEVGGSAARPLRGVVIMTFVATASVTEPVPRTPASRPNLVSVGTIIWLSSELMFFAALFAMYFTIRSVDKGQGLPWPRAHLNLALGSINTTVLLLSSVTCQMGVFAVERGQIKRTRSIFHPMSWGLREWYVLTFLMGLYFDLGQGYEYLDLV